MTSTWQLLFGLTLVMAMLLTLANCQDDLDLDYSNEYDNVRPHFIYPDEPRLDKRLTSAAQQFGESVKNAWQSMVDSFHNYFEELRDVFADGVNNNAEELPVSN
ncbi:uncharacterized protein LOC117793710 [Drosophila innubila]|uniref:uncharacterized protein LOC117793710 n=1 Tax=Drosophila innubila TaxID=198719 RepID=UPI00148DE983|nr:uncharacterized protein LOC117793710 [Drosophila innubila]